MQGHLAHLLAAAIFLRSHPSPWLDVRHLRLDDKVGCSSHLLHIVEVMNLPPLHDALGLGIAGISSLTARGRRKTQADSDHSHPVLPRKSGTENLHMSPIIQTERRVARPLLHWTRDMVCDSNEPDARVVEVPRSPLGRHLAHRRSSAPSCKRRCPAGPHRRTTGPAPAARAAGGWVIDEVSGPPPGRTRTARHGRGASPSRHAEADAVCLALPANQPCTRGGLRGQRRLRRPQIRYAPTAASAAESAAVPTDPSACDVPNPWITVRKAAKRQLPPRNRSQVRTDIFAHPSCRELTVLPLQLFFEAFGARNGRCLLGAQGRVRT